MTKSSRSTQDPKGSTASQGRAKVKAQVKLAKSEALKTVEGVVVARGTRTGIAGVQVFLHADATGDGPRIGAAITDKDGKFAIRHPVTVRSVEISTSDATDSVVRGISRSRKAQLRFALTAEELSRLLPRRDAERKGREDRWEREALIRREMVHSRALEVIEKLQRRREFGAKIASQIELSTIPAEIRREDLSYVEPDATAEERSERLLEVARQGVAQADPKSRAVKLEPERLAELRELSAEHGKLPLESILVVGVQPNTPPASDAALEILEALRTRATNGSEGEPTDRDSTGGGTDMESPADTGAGTDTESLGDTETEEPIDPEDDEEVSTTQFVRDEVGRLYQNGAGTDLPVGRRGDQVSVAAEIGGVSMGGGPADVTSYHEFRNVRIAFDPLWTEYFDPGIAKLVEKILGGLERFEEDLPFEEITALEALEPFLDIAEELGADLDEPAEILTPPDVVKELLPDMTPSTYTSLSPDLREDVEFLGRHFEAVMASIDRGGAIVHPPVPWIDYDHDSNPAPEGDYVMDSGRVVNFRPPMPDFWLIVGLFNKVIFNDREYVDRAEVLDDTGYDIAPGTPPEPTIYTYQGTTQRYLKEKNYATMKINSRTYVWVQDAKEKLREHFEREAQSLVQPALDLLAQPADDGDEPEEDKVQTNLESLATILSNEKEEEAYRFKVFNAGSVNFGILLKYQQAWEPQNYQVGDLVRTIPLAPKESRRFKKRLVVKKSRNQKEIESALQTKSDSEENTGRAESEIVRRAQNATNFEATASGKGGIGVVEFGGSATAKASAQEQNTKNKRKMRQAVQKAAHEYKQERRVEITTVDSEETEGTESGEISNPNEEITVTYMFYELQKRFLVSERLVEIEPVVLIAHDVPLPSQITESWLIRHDWILKRVLLDDSFLPAFKLLDESNKGRDVLIGILRDDLQRKVKAFEEIKEQVAANMRVKDAATAALKKAVDLRVDAINAQHTTGEEAGDVALTIFTGGLFGSQGLLGVGGTAGDDFEKPEAAEARQEAVEDMLARTAEEARRLRSLLEAAEVALDSAIHKYSDAVRGRFNKELAVFRLRNHIAQNILHYMQAIWEYEPPDQRFFRLYDIRVPVIGGDVGVDVGENEVTLTFSRDGIEMSSPDLKRLADVADLDNLVGYKGNYMIFALRQHNYLTAWMAQDYLDGNGHVRDPEAHQMPDPGQSLQAVSIEVQTLQAMSVELNHEIAQVQATPSWEGMRPAFEAARNSLSHQIQLERSKIAEVIVPTDLLFIEALPGKHPLLEDFKLVHRSLDVEKVAAERDTLRLENIRRTARLLAGNYDDPEVDKLISLEGGQTTVVTET